MKKEFELKNNSIIHLGISTIVIFVFFLALFISFYYLLDQQVSTIDIGWQQITMALAIAIIATTVLSLARGIMYRNPALGMAIGVASIIISLTALFSIYKGPFTTTFAIIGSLGVVVYLGIAFWKSRKN